MKSFLTTAALVSLFAAAGSGSAQNVRIDASGTNGKDPVDGQYPGGHATQGTPGGHAKNVDLYIKDSMGVRGYLILTATLTDEFGNQTVDINNRSLDLTSRIFVDASGGLGARWLRSRGIHRSHRI